MKKKLLSTILAVFLMIGMTGCAGKEQVIEKETNYSKVKEDEETGIIAVDEKKDNEELASIIREPKDLYVPFPKDLSNNIHSYQMKIDGVIYQFPMWYDDFVSKGWTFTRNEKLDPRCGIDFSVKLGNFNPKVCISNFSGNEKSMEECEIIGIRIDSYSYSQSPETEIILPGGFKMGEATIGDVLEMYGKPKNQNTVDGVISVTYGGDEFVIPNISLEFDEATRKLFAVDMKNQKELEGIDFSIKNEVPEEVINYKGPQAVSNNLLNFTFQLEGHVYQFPCPIKEFTDNGFILEDAPESIWGTEYGHCDLVYKGQSDYIYVTNMAKYETIPENCWATTIKFSEQNDNWDFSLSGGITRGTKEEDLIEYLEKNNLYYEKEENNQDVYYCVRQEKYSIEQYEFTIRDGVVLRVEITGPYKLVEE